MIIVYTPKDGEAQHFDVGPGKLRASEIQIIERTADARWADIKAAVRMGEIGALRVAAWAVKKRAQPSLRFNDFDPFEGELAARLDTEEVKGYADVLFERYREDPDDLAEAFDELRDAAFDREVAEKAIADVTAPKDQVPGPDQEPTTETASATA